MLHFLGERSFVTNTAELCCKDTVELLMFRYFYAAANHCCTCGYWQSAGNDGEEEGGEYVDCQVEKYRLKNPRH
jgi:hypothetical protein